MEITISEDRAKELLKQVLIELLQERRDLFYEVMLDAMEEVGLANAIREGRQNECVSENDLLTVLKECKLG